MAKMNYRDRLLLLTKENERLREVIGDSRSEVARREREQEALLKARVALSAFAGTLQVEFKDEVEPLLTMAVRDVFSEDYVFSLAFNERKDRTEILPVVFDGGLELSPKEDMGGGILPIIGFPLRVILLGGRRRLIWLDEPLKGALGRRDDLFFRAIKMFKEVSSRLGIQVIVSSHEEDIADLADAVFEVVKVGRESRVRRIKPGRRIWTG